MQYFVLVEMMFKTYPEYITYNTIFLIEFNENLTMLYFITKVSIFFLLLNFSFGSFVIILVANVNKKNDDFSLSQKKHEMNALFKAKHRRTFFSLF